MLNLRIYCTSIKYLNILDKLPSYIKPLGLNNYNYPEHWNTEKKGENISHLNKHFGEATGFYWILKNKLKNKNENDWIGSCQYRRLWLNKLYEKKQKLSYNSLYSNLLNPNNEIFSKCDSILLQPTIFKKETAHEQFNKIYGKNIIDDCINFLEKKDKEKFENYLNGNKLSICNMFITKTEKIAFRPTFHPFRPTFHPKCLKCRKQPGSNPGANAGAGSQPGSREPTRELTREPESKS